MGQYMSAVQTVLEINFFGVNEYIYWLVCFISKVVPTYSNVPGNDECNLDRQFSNSLHLPHHTG